MNWPAKLSGTTRMTGWLNQLLAACQSSQVVTSDSILVARATYGTKLKSADGVGGGGTYHEFKLCRNGQQITVDIDSKQDPATVEDDA